MKIRAKENGVLMFKCPGCMCVHRFNSTWQVSGTEDAPTVTPSILVTGWVNASDTELGSRQVRCHSFITAGKIQFLDDCVHGLKGKTVPVPEWEEES